MHEVVNLKLCARRQNIDVLKLKMSSLVLTEQGTWVYNAIAPPPTPTLFCHSCLIFCVCISVQTISSYHQVHIMSVRWTRLRCKLVLPTLQLPWLLQWDLSVRMEHHQSTWMWTYKLIYSHWVNYSVWVDSMHCTLKLYIYCSIVQYDMVTFSYYTV